MFEALFSKAGLSLDRLRSFLEMAEAGGIAKAAPGDAVRQSQISRQIRELEEFFGTELTLRRGKGLVLTPAGSRLADLIRGQLQGLDDFRREEEGTSQGLCPRCGGEPFGMARHAENGRRSRGPG